MKVLVTGGSGFLGKGLQKVMPEWKYLSSKDLDLRDAEWCRDWFETYKPDAIIHLASRVGGIKDNIEHPAEFFQKNILMNSNLLEIAYRSGVKRVLSSLSTCAFPDVLHEYPFTERDILMGPPAESNLSYGFAKRALYVQSIAYRKQYGVNYSCFAPSNIYGPGDDFDPRTSHFAPSLVHRIYNSEKGDTLKFWGTGEPKRQQLFVDDLARIIPMLLDRHNSDEPIIVAPEENLSIRVLIYNALSILRQDREVEFTGEMEGQMRKDGSNKKLIKLIGSFEFTPFIDGIKKTYDWYEQQQD